MLTSKMVVISVLTKEFENDKGEKVPYEVANIELEGGKLLNEVSVQKGAMNGVKRFEEVKGYFDFKPTSGNKGKLVITGYTR